MRKVGKFCSRDTFPQPYQDIFLVNIDHVEPSPSIHAVKLRP